MKSKRNSGDIFAKGFIFIDKQCPFCGHALIKTKSNLITCWNFDLGIMDLDTFDKKYGKNKYKITC